MTRRTFPSFLLYQDDNGRWRWSYSNSDGNEVAAGKAAFGSREACMQAIRDLQRSEGQPAFAFRPSGSAGPADDADDGVLDLGTDQAVD